MELRLKRNIRFLILFLMNKIVLEAFLRNLLLNEKNELHNRNLHINGLLNEEKVDIEDTKVDFENGKVDIQDKKVDFEKFDFDEVFGRSAVMELLERKARPFKPL